jgi:two-component system chemotaxis response regulator CheY
MRHQVLIVAEKEQTANEMVEILKSCQVTDVILANSGNSALAKAEYNQFDLIICEWKMPVMSGLEFFENAQKGELINNTPLLMVSAENEKSKVLKALSAGIADYLVKPFSAEMLISKVKKLLKITTEIQWSEKFSLENEIIDNDHKYLITLINAINLAVDCDISRDDLLAHISLLEAHSKKHFQREEKMMVNVECPDLARHRADHQNLLNKLRDLYEDIQRKTSIEECRETIPMVELLSSWVIRDILEQDKRIKEHFISFQKSKCGHTEEDFKKHKS